VEPGSAKEVSSIVRYHSPLLLHSPISHHHSWVSWDLPVLFPSALRYTWSNPLYDNTFAGALRLELNALRCALLVDEQDVAHAAASPNSALFDTPVEDIYGINLPRLLRIKTKIDPRNVMRLAGGFQIRRFDIEEGQENGHTTERAKNSDSRTVGRI
jgi:hypothetical protein